MIGDFGVLSRRGSDGTKLKRRGGRLGVRVIFGSGMVRRGTGKHVGRGDVGRKGEKGEKEEEEEL